jgi:hypothetical protein
MKKFRRTFYVSISLLIMAGLVYLFYGFSTAEGRVKAACSQIKPGISISQLSVFADEYGLSPRPRNEAGINYMVEKKSYGRHGCKVMLEAGVVKAVEYNFAD